MKIQTFLLLLYYISTTLSSNAQKNCFSQIIADSLNSDQTTMVIYISKHCGYCKLALKELLPYKGNFNCRWFVIYADGDRSSEIDSFARINNVETISTNECINEKVLKKIVPQIWGLNNRGKPEIKIRGWDKKRKKRLLKYLQKQ